MPEILTTQDATRRAIRAVFRDRRRRRVAVVAFVGDGARGYLGHPEGVEIYCWPKAGGTNPRVIQELRDLGARVYFADRLHMKLYWASKGDAVIGSANLTSNALGAGDLKELAVRVPAASVPIDRILREIAPVKVTGPRLASLERAHERYYARHGNTGPRTEAVSFAEWYTLRPRPRWLLSWAQSDATYVARRARVAAKQQHGSVVGFVSCRRGETKPEQWIMTVMTNQRQLTSPDWLYVHTTVLVERGDRAYEKGWPFHAVQVLPDRQCPRPPFRIDSPFRMALREFARELGPQRLKGRLLHAATKPVPDDLLKRLYTHYVAAARAQKARV